MERYGHVLVKAFTERVDGPGLEATVVCYKELHDQVSAWAYGRRICESCSLRLTSRAFGCALELFVLA